ncbi:MAG: LD-carboxypeptidase [Roseburia sp. CAG:197_41_10]|nr:MAG: LD-carboxypeptidase [Roseburia sp. CAG:197_41_10]
MTVKKGDKIGIVCCSNGQPQTARQQIEILKETLIELGLVPVFSKYIFDKGAGFSGSAKERAESLMEFYKDTEIKAIFDISGGDIANEILPYLDFKVIGNSKKQFWGYSDLTTILNAIYAQTGNTSVLYQIRNLIYDNGEKQQKDFAATIFEKNNSLFSFPYEFVQGETLQGSVIGGNIRCFLKLAGTPYFPEVEGKVLLLYLSQLQQMGVFEKISGILLGTFTKMEEADCVPDMVELVKRYVGELPVVKTDKIGHGTDAKGIIIGKEIFLVRQK